MRCFTASAVAISTPASAYFMDEVRSRFPFGQYESGRTQLDFGDRQVGAAFTRTNSNTKYKLKCVEQTLPAHDSRVQDRVRVSEKSFAHFARFPRIRRRIERHINHHRLPDDIFSRHATPEPAVVRIRAVVAHCDITVVGNVIRKLQLRKSERRVSRWNRLRRANSVWLHQFFVVDVDRTAAQIDRVARHRDRALDQIRRLRRIRRPKNNHVLPVRIPPQRHMPIRKGNARVDADPAHDQVIPDQQRVLHRPRRNHARLPDRSIDQHERQRHPEPRDGFAAGALAHRQRRFLLRLHIFCVVLSFYFHVSPPNAVRFSRVLPLGFFRLSTTVLRLSAFSWMSKRAKDPLPPNLARMKDRARIRQKSLANLPRLPGIWRHIQRHINHHRRPNDVLTRHAAPKPAVVRVRPIVAHRKITIVWDLVRKLDVRVTGRRTSRRRGFTRPDRVILHLLLPIHVNRSAVNVDDVARQADRPLHIIRRIRRKWRLENNHLLPPRIAPQRNMPIRERHASVVPDPAHDQVIPDQQCVLHRPRRNYSRLPDRPVDQHERQRNPEPRDNLALHTLAHRDLGFLLFLFAHLDFPLSFRALL